MESYQWTNSSTVAFTAFSRHVAQGYGNCDKCRAMRDTAPVRTLLTFYLHFVQNRFENTLLHIHPIRMFC